MDYIPAFNDVYEVQQSILSDLRKRQKTNPEVRVRQVIDDVWDDLDVALIGAEEERAERRIRVVNAVLDQLGLQGVRNVLIGDYLARRSFWRDVYDAVQTTRTLH